MRFIITTLVLLNWLTSCKQIDKRNLAHQTEVEDIKREPIDSVYRDPLPTLVNFKLRYTVVLSTEYIRWPEPGEDDDYPAIFSIGQEALSIHTPIYQLDAANYYTYRRGDSLVYESAQKAHEIDDYWYHLRVDDELLKTRNNSGEVLEKGEAYFFRFPSNEDSTVFWVLFNVKEEFIELYNLHVSDSISSLIKRFNCFSKDLWDMAVINECRFRVVYNTVLYYNPMNNGYFYIDLDNGISRCGSMPRFADHLIGISEAGGLIVTNHKKSAVWVLDKNGRKLEELKWSLETSTYDELLFDPRQNKILLTKHDWDSFQFDIYETSIE